MGQHWLYKCKKIDKNALHAKSTSDKFKTLSQSTSDRLSARRSMVFLFIIRVFVCSFFLDASGQDNHKMQKWADGQ